MALRRNSWFILVGGAIILLIVTMLPVTGWSQDDYLAEYIGTDADSVGSDACLMCHSDMTPTSLFTHATIIDNDPGNPDFGYGCEGCHGPGGSHMGDVAGILYPPSMSVDEVTDLCTKCHGNVRSFALNTWYLSEHYGNDLSCISCHGGHSDYDAFLVTEVSLDLCNSCHSEKRAEFNMRSHHPVDEGQLECLSCHNPHSGEFEYQLVADGDELCFECHADKQGPFIYDHPVSQANGGDGCTTCHFVHGSNTDNLLRFPNRLCLQCHTDRGPDTHDPGSCWTAGCHSEIHGTNGHPLFLY